MVQGSFLCTVQVQQHQSKAYERLGQKNSQTQRSRYEINTQKTEGNQEHWYLAFYQKEYFCSFLKLFSHNQSRSSFPFPKETILYKDIFLQCGKGSLLEFSLLNTLNMESIAGHSSEIQYTRVLWANKVISVYSTPAFWKETRILHAYLQNYERLFTPKQGAYLEHIWTSECNIHTKNRAHLLPAFGKPSLWFYKIALNHILKYRVGSFALDQEADLCPKGTKLCSSCHGTASIFVY